LNHAPGDTINPQSPIAADANNLISLPLSGNSRHGGTCWGLRLGRKWPLSSLCYETSVQCCRCRVSST